MEELVRLAGSKPARGRVILAHLGAGASLAAVRDGKSIDTSMGFTPTSGVPMGTRAGDLDPGLVLYLANTEKMSAKQFNEMICFQSGLLGISETSSDMHDLLESETRDVRAAEAIALFCYQIKKWIGAFAAALGGLDTLVFAGGIGENAPTVRARICEGLGFLGIELDEKQNAANSRLDFRGGGRVLVRVMHTDEESMIAKTVCRVLGLGCEKGDGTVTTKVLSQELLDKMNAYWRAANYLSVGQIYLYDNPLLEGAAENVRRKASGGRALGHDTGQNFIYVHLNRVIKKYDLDMFYIAGPGHGGPALVANTYLEGSLQRDLSEYQSGRSRDEEALHPIFFSGRDLGSCRARQRRARSTKVASWGIRSVMPSGPRSTIQI